MPMPWIYRHASKEWSAFLSDVKDRMDLTSDNMPYAAADGVFQVFRRRLSVQQGLNFADVLPSVLRAIFVYRWDMDQAPVPFTDRDALTAEVKQVRVNHNLTPDNAIEATAWAIRRCTGANNALRSGRRHSWPRQRHVTLESMGSSGREEDMHEEGCESAYI